LTRRFNIKGAPSRNPREILREQRTQRGFSNSPEHIGADVPGGTVEDEREQRRRERARQHLHDMRRARGFASIE
jgi:hypothetical protein